MVLKNLQVTVWVFNFIFFSGFFVNSIKTVCFADGKDEKLATNTTIPLSRIANSDLLSITVSTLNPEAAGINEPKGRRWVLEACGLAGDITIYGNKGNVLLIREETGQRLIRQLNVNSRNLFLSPYCYVKSNDANYVSRVQQKLLPLPQLRNFYRCCSAGFHLLPS